MGIRLPFTAPAWSCKGKHIFITGGSQGLGLALAEIVASKGADVTICSRSKDKLEEAISLVKSRIVSPSQKIAYTVADVSTFEGASNAIESTLDVSSSPDAVGRIPDTVFCCAGASKPGYFVQQTEADFLSGFKTIYMTALSTSHAAAKLFVKIGKKDAKIVLVSSTLGLMGLVGYSQYAPMKFALRGEYDAKCLRSEFQLYDISIHAYFPGTILSPGFQEENKTKPALTKKLEGGESDGQTPEQCARGLLKGVEANHFFITTDFLTELFRASSATGGSIPSNNWLLDRAKAFIALIGLPIWRLTEERMTIRGYREEHRKEIAQHE
ncbi:hypothetical protein CBS101457_002516 [Exobasidium rhododendri]|nr:hypothetical protein CBS101457_002516 [Exobasidium rhododendri]